MTYDGDNLELYVNGRLAVRRLIGQPRTTNTEPLASTQYDQWIDVAKVGIGVEDAEFGS